MLYKCGVKASISLHLLGASASHSTASHTGCCQFMEQLGLQFN